MTIITMVMLFIVSLFQNILDYSGISIPDTLGCVLISGVTSFQGVKF